MTQFPVPIPDPITSAANVEVKSLRALHERKYRKKSGWFLAEGARIKISESEWIDSRIKIKVLRIKIKVSESK